MKTATSTPRDTKELGHASGKAGGKADEATAFFRILCAMYNKPYVLGEMFDLQRMTRQADYYCALPVVSASLSTAFWHSPKFLKLVQRVPAWFLPDAQKLRHAVLFLGMPCAHYQ